MVSTLHTPLDCFAGCAGFLTTKVVINSKSISKCKYLNIYASRNIKNTPLRFPNIKSVSKVIGSKSKCPQSRNQIGLIFIPLPLV